MPLDNLIGDVQNVWITIIVGSCFWLFLILGVITQIVLSKHYKIVFGKKQTKEDKQPKLGLISFFKNGFATLADLLMAISLIGLIVSMILSNSSGYICYIFLALLAFSFCMHCILNGKIYYQIQKQKNGPYAGDKTSGVKQKRRYERYE